MKRKEKFELLKARVRELVEKAEKLASKYDEVNLEYLDNQEACELLKLSPRSLQNHRSAGRVAYTKVENKIYYKRDDLLKFLNDQKV